MMVISYSLAVGLCLVVEGIDRVFLQRLTRGLSRYCGKTLNSRCRAPYSEGTSHRFRAL